MNNIDKMYQAGMSLPEISEKTGIPTSTVRNRLIRDGVKMRTRKEALALSTRLGIGLIGKSRVFTEEHKRNISRARKRHGESNAAGVSLKPSGYVEFTRGPNKGRAVHRVVMEEHLGRRLERREHVHHKDGDRTNNAIENLELISIEDHARHHRLDGTESPTRDKLGRYTDGKRK